MLQQNDSINVNYIPYQGKLCVTIFSLILKRFEGLPNRSFKYPNIETLITAYQTVYFPA